MSTPTNRPSHRVYAVTKNGERSFWQPIGAAWVHSDGWGFNLKLDYLPLNGAEIVIRKPKVEETDAPAGEAASLGWNPSSRRQIYVIFFASGFGNLTNLKFKCITNWPVAARPNESSGS
jgi:hypothetical protein